MNRFLLTLFITSVMFCISSANSVHKTRFTELSDKIRDIVEKCLEDKQNKNNRKENDTNLIEKIEFLENRLATLETRLVDQSKVILDLQDVLKNVYDFRRVNQDIETNDLTKNSTAVEASNYLTHVKSIQPNKQRLRRAVSAGNVAFSVYLSHTNSHTIIGNAVRFDKVLLNNGSGYNEYTGAFTAPVSGVYLFTFHFDSRKLTFLRLVVNGVNVVDAVANRHTNAESRHSQSMAGNSAVIFVKHGEAVLVEPYEIPDAETASSDTFRLCSFSGVLLY